MFVNIYIYIYIYIYICISVCVYGTGKGQQEHQCVTSSSARASSWLSESITVKSAQYCRGLLELEQGSFKGVYKGYYKGSIRVL